MARELHDHWFKEAKREGYLQSLKKSMFAVNP